jgi:hypothetical protein
VQRFRPNDIRLLSALGSTAKQHDQQFAVFRQINPITRTPIDYVFAVSTPASPFDEMKAGTTGSPV